MDTAPGSQETRSKGWVGKAAEKGGLRGVRIGMDLTDDKQMDKKFLCLPLPSHPQFQPLCLHPLFLSVLSESLSLYSSLFLSMNHSISEPPREKWEKKTEMIENAEKKLCVCVRVYACVRACLCVSVHACTQHEVWSGECN